MGVNRRFIYQPRNICKRRIKYEAEALEKLADFIKGAVDRECKQLRVDKQTNNLSSEMDEEYVELLGDALFTVNERFRRTLYYSHIVTVYSFLENSLDDICKLAQKNAQLKLSYKGIKGSGLDRIKTYIKKVLHYDFSKNLNGEWRQIKTLNTVRNAIVHNEGYLIKKKKLTQVQHLIKQNLIELNDSNRIEIRHEYTVFVINNIYKFVGTLCDELLMKDRNKEILV